VNSRRRLPGGLPQGRRVMRKNVWSRTGVETRGAHSLLWPPRRAVAANSAAPQIRKVPVDRGPNICSSADAGRSRDCGYGGNASQLGKPRSKALPTRVATEWRPPRRIAGSARLDDQKPEAPDHQSPARRRGTPRPAPNELTTSRLAGRSYPIGSRSLPHSGADGKHLGAIAQPQQEGSHGGTAANQRLVASTTAMEDSSDTVFVALSGGQPGKRRTMWMVLTSAFLEPSRLSSSRRFATLV